MTRDERFLKMLKIEPCEIPEPSAPANDEQDIEAEQIGGTVLMSRADFDCVVQANRALHGEALAHHAAAEKWCVSAGDAERKMRNWRLACFILCGIILIDIIYLVCIFWAVSR